MAGIEVESPHVSVLRDYSEFLHTHLEPRIEVLLPPLVKAGVLTKKNRERIECSGGVNEQVEYLLGYLKGKNADRFVKFLQVLRSLVEENEEDKDVWSCLERLTTKVENAQLPLTRASEAMLSEISSFVSQVKLLKSGSRPARQTQLPPSSIPLLPIDESCSVINEANRRLYSPLHGVSVCFSSFPPGTKEFKLHFSVYDPSCCKLPEDFELCTAVIRLNTIPEGLQFSEDSVSVSIPHCAVITCLADADSLSIRALSDHNLSTSLDFSKGEEIKGDFGDGYHANFTVSHFTGYAGVVDRKRRKRQRFPDSLLNTRHAPERPPKKSNTSPEAPGTISPCPPQCFSPFEYQVSPIRHSLSQKVCTVNE